MVWDTQKKDALSIPVANVMYTDVELLRIIFGGKWRLAVLQELCMRPLRLSELKIKVSGCSKKVLIDTLHDLELTQIITRVDLSDRVRKVEYHLDDTYALRMRSVLRDLGKAQDDLR